MNDAQRESLLNRLERTSQEQSVAAGRRNRRSTRRWPYQQPDVAVTVEHPGGGNSRLAVCARNLSVGGLAFIHAGYLHKQSRCKVVMRQLDGKLISTIGKVVSCRHIEGMLHEIGLQFDEPIDPLKFVQSGEEQPEAAAGNGAVPIEPLSGKFLYIDDSLDEQELIKFVLGTAGAEVHVAGVGTEGVEMAGKTEFTAIILELLLTGANGCDTALALRTAGYVGPIIAVSADENQTMRDEAIAKGCWEVLAKPIDFEKLTGLLRKSEKNIPFGHGAQPITSTRWKDKAMRPLILQFLERLPEQIDKLRQSLTANDATAVRKLCLNLKGAAGGYGYPDLSNAAEMLRALVEANAADVGPIQQQLAMLTTMCNAACSVRRGHPKDGAAEPPAKS